MSKSKSRAPITVEISAEVWEQMWRVIDAARLISCPPRGTGEDEVRGALADSHKMLERSLSWFYGPESEERLREGTATKHPYIVHIEQLDRELRLKAILED